MYIEKSTLTQWNKLRSPDDVGTMLKDNPGTYRQQFDRAFSTGKTSVEILTIMANFYKLKAKKLKTILK